MNVSFEKSNSNLVRVRCCGQMLLLFLTGNLLGGVLVRYFGISTSLFSGIVDKAQLTGYFGSGFFQVLLSEGKFLLLLYLLSFQRWGAMMVPPVFGIEGIYFGMTISSLMSAMGPSGAVVAFLLMLFRLILILPYGFLLGGWAVERSLSFPDRSRNAFGVLTVTLSVMVLGALLESTLARWLGGMYYLKFGV